jgi:AcrR family transcriptional regulator
VVDGRIGLSEPVMSVDAPTTNPAVPRKRGAARGRLLDLAETAVLEKGFSGTSIEELIVGAGITKSGFFYHFPDKSALAKALLERFLERDFALLEEIFARAEELDDDPLHCYLIALKMLAEVFADLPNGHPGCLVAATAYQEQLFSQEVRDLNHAGVKALRARFRKHLDRIVESRALRDPAVLPQQLLLYRDFIRMLFQP